MSWKQAASSSAARRPPSAPTIRCAAPISAIEGDLIGRAASPTCLGSGAGRRLRDNRAGFGDDFSGDAAREFRAGRDGDVLDLSRVVAAAKRLELLAGFPRH